ncbi:centrosomal protein of 128 kDa-like isoform X2 [Engraulis encrasicolus]|uniref:centrosomal protein of 128 kDa-like isoform X2 n=1 Tax=Engraulis encrasicolus TaxID=184585 RepID=UPI002FD34419
MESDSGSDTFDRPRRYHSRGREPSRGRSRDKCGNDGTFSEKLDTLANTLQDTSVNLQRVDQMLGQYREHTDDQAEVMATLRDTLEDSIKQLQQTQHLRRASGSHSASFSTLHTSDLEDDSTSDGLHHCPTSPLKDYGGNRRRSRSATVRFRDPGETDDVHALHRSLRDLRSDQLRLSDDVNREIHRRNRSEVETRRSLENLNGRLRASQKDAASVRVEQRLQDIGRGIPPERQQPPPERQRTQTHEASNFQQVQMERELELARRRLEQSEGGRDTLLQQVEDMRGQLLRTERERVELQQQLSLLTTQQSRSSARTEDRRGGAAGGGAAGGGGAGGDFWRTTERGAQDVRSQMEHVSLSDLEDFKRVLDRKDRERAQLCSQVEALTADLQQGEQRQRRMLSQLQQLRRLSLDDGLGGPANATAAEREKEKEKEREREREKTQAQVQAEARLAESERRREELKSRAQAAVRHWKGRCRRLEKDLEELQEQAKQGTDKAQQEVRERESAHTTLRAVTLQAEGARRELAEVLGRLAQREEEVRRGEQERQRLEREVEEVRRASRDLQEETQRQAGLQERLREESRRLEERAEALERERARERSDATGLQRELKSLATERAEAVGRLAREEEARREAQQRLLEIQQEQGEAKRRMEEDREVHRLHRSEAEVHIRELKAEVASEREAARMLRVKLERMKEECARLSEQHGSREETHTQLLRKQQALKAQLEDKAKSVSRAEERCRAAEASASELRERLGQLESDMPSILQAVGEHIHTACLSLAPDTAQDKLTAITQSPGLQKDPNRWLAETKSALQWLCEELRERGDREGRVRGQLQQCRRELKGLRGAKEQHAHETHTLRQKLQEQQSQLKQLAKDKRDLQEKNSRRDEEMRALQDRVLDLEMQGKRGVHFGGGVEVSGKRDQEQQQEEEEEGRCSVGLTSSLVQSTRLALEHLETSSQDNKPSLMDDFKDLEESQRQREAVEQRYSRYKEIVGGLQHQLEESKRKIHEYRGEKLEATSRSLHLAGLSSSLRGKGTYMSSTLLTNGASAAAPGRLSSPEPDSLLLSTSPLITVSEPSKKHRSNV